MSGRRSRPRNARPEARVGIAFVLPAAAFLLLFVAYPVFEAVRISLREIELLTDAERFVGLANYHAIFDDPKFATVAINTAVWTLGSLAGQFALGLAAALCIHRDLPGMWLVRSILLLPYVVPVIALALFWRWMLDGSFGIISYALQAADALDPNQSPLALPSGAMASVILANVWRGFPFVMISYWAALQGIPKDQYESARLDGANAWQEFRYVTWPHLLDVTRVLLILRLIWTVTFFDIVWLITRGGPGGATEHWPVWIYQETMGFFRFGYGAALAITLGLALLTVSVLYVLLVARSRAA